MTLGLAIDLCRGITAADRAMRRGDEKWLLAGAGGCFSLYGARVGLIGFGDLAAPSFRWSALRRNRRAYDPWVSAHFMKGSGSRRRRSTKLERIAGDRRVRRGHQREPGFLGRREFELVTPGSVVLLMSRAGVVDFPEFLRAVESGRFRAATDVFPIEPAPRDDPARKGRRSGPVAAPRRRDDGFAARDRPPDGRRRGTDPARPAAAVLPARPARDRRAIALEADRSELVRRRRRLSGRRSDSCSTAFGHRIRPLIQP